MLRILTLVCLVGTGALGAPQRIQLQGTPRPGSYGGPTSPPNAGSHYSQQLNIGGPQAIQSTSPQTLTPRFRIPPNYQQQQPIILSQTNPTGAPQIFQGFQSSTPFPSLGQQQRSPIQPLRSPSLPTTTSAADDEEYEDEEYEDEPAAAPRPTQPQQFSPTLRPLQRGPPQRIPQQQFYNQPQPQRIIQQTQPQQQRRPVQQQRPVAPQPTPQQLQVLQPLASRQPQQRPQGNDGGRKRVTTPPPVQTLNRYMRTNDDGSITWGYENEDGTFKQESLGVDCVVRGKYGYVDPDGNKREYEYQSGNPCDPNKRGQEEEEDQLLDGPQEQQLPRFNSGGGGGPRPLSARRPIQQQQLN